MQFNTYLFFLFFGWVLSVHYSPLSWRVRKTHLLAASYLFYAAWDPPLVLLLWVSTAADWFLARAIAAADSRRRKRAMLLLSLLVNLGLLAYFKYGSFLVENFAAALGAVGVSWQPAAPDIILPIGISFYTFETLSYTIDVYRGHCRPFRSFVDYALFLSFFPHLIAGPILRPAEIVPQFAEPRRAGRVQLGWGLALLVLGIFEKNVIADGLFAPAADKAFAAEVLQLDAAAAWLGTLAFAGQIFCDFAGYSTSAIGAALCLGFHFPDNFRFPYAAIGFSDFWRRWHVSLSRWLRDYLYVPLGGNRKGSLRTHVNLMLTMLIGGLWHGASWTFVAWGGLHGLYLVGERLARARFPSPVWSTWPARIALGALTFALVCLAWTFFRAQSFEQAFRFTGAMVGLGAGVADVSFGFAETLLVLVPMAAILILHWLLRDISLEEAVERCSWPIRSVALAAVSIAIACMPGTDRAFIYFQF